MRAFLPRTPDSQAADELKGGPKMTWVKRILAALVVGFFLFYLIQQPEAAAGAVRTVFSAVGVAFQSIVRFFTSLASG
jgi:hypothetical protein